MATQDRVSLKQLSEGVCLFELKGNWSIHDNLVDLEEVLSHLEAGSSLKKITFDTSDLGKWDSSIIVFSIHVLKYAQVNKIEFDKASLPKGIQQLISLSQAVPEKIITHRTNNFNFVYKFGQLGIQFARGTVEVCGFLGELTKSFGRLFKGTAQFRWSDCLLIVQQSGAEALPIVALISFLVGLIMAFVGAIQLQPFGASIYVANLVALAMVREMGAMMTGVIMAGRTGASFAASIGSMKVSEELDALKTMGISPIDFLAMPRVLALFIMMPLLCVFSNYIGILGGMLVAMLMLDVSMVEYINQTKNSITLMHASTGVIKSTVFGILIAGIGCLRGMQCGTSSAAVGHAATSAVVTGITALIMTDAIFAVLFNALKI